MKDQIQALQAQLAEALAFCRENVDKLPGSKLADATAEVQRLQAEISSEITRGANKCPDCGNAPIGMQHPKARGAFEFEIGCPVCKPFEHEDGTIRDHRVRGGMMPHHAVEAWNAGPSFWLVTKPAVAGTGFPLDEEPST